MISKMTQDQCLQFLRTEVVGRIGCHANGKTYVVPVTYAFDGKFIYAHSKEGLKISIMRKNRNICFEVDKIENMACWRSVIARGEYEELTTRTAQAIAMKILRDRLSPLMVSEAIKPVHGDTGPEQIEKQLKAVAYRFKVNEISGRYEQPS